MWSTTRRWLAGPVLALASLCGAAAPSLVAQVPRPTSPAGAVPSSPTGGPAQPALDAGTTASRGPVTVAKQGDLLRFNRSVPGDAKPIVIDADEITTWEEDGKL